MLDSLSFLSLVGIISVDCRQKKKMKTLGSILMAENTRVSC